ncbi:MAG: hypothetical protein JSW71_03520 [Gemmatimonadota bacterium]|nr:MAG: hypothetical protein JSW71_03520 [Gemmatimonadota bacterium]
MNWNGHKYEDRFGNVWSARVESQRGERTSVSFNCGELRLVASEEETGDHSDDTATRLKELFCAAERIVVHEKQKWYVGYRKRIGRGGRAQGLMHTRFRSEDGEVRYAKGMLHFRHMRQNVLCKHLAAAVPAARRPARVS